MNQGQDTYSDITEIYRRLEALETAARVPQLTTTVSGLQSAATGTGVNVAPQLSSTLTMARLTSALSVPFIAGQQGKAVLLYSFNHTFDASAGSPTVRLSPGVVGQTPDSYLNAISITNASSPFTRQDVAVSLVTGLTAGPQTACVYGRYSGGTLLDHYLNAQNFIVLPL